VDALDSNCPESNAPLLTLTNHTALPFLIISEAHNIIDTLRRERGVHVR